MPERLTSLAGSRPARPGRLGRGRFRPGWAETMVGAAFPALLLMMVAGLPPAFAASGTLTYDSSLCGVDPEGKVYIALWDQVLRVPARQLGFIRDYPPEKAVRAPQPPDPGVPEGCPGNPIRAAGFTLGTDLATWDAGPDAPPVVEGRARQVSLVATEPDFWGLQPSLERGFLGACSKALEREYRNDGLVVCRIPRSDPSIPKEKWTFVGQADLDMYPTPTGRPFTVECRISINELYHICIVMYKFYPRLNVYYEFHTNQLPIEQVIDFDRALRARLEAAHVRDYDWSPAAESGPASANRAGEAGR